MANESHSWMKVGIIMTYNDNGTKKYLLMKQIDQTWEGKDACKVKWSFPKTTRIPEDKISANTARRVCETKLFTRVPLRLFQKYDIITQQYENKSRILECYWRLSINDMTDQFTFLPEIHSSARATHYKWATMGEIKQLMRGDDLSYGTKVWAMNQMKAARRSYKK
jgi:hypothetical protein